MVPSQNAFHRPAFPTTRGTTQGGLVSPTLFTMVVDNVIRTWLAMMVEDQQVDQDGLVETVGRCVGVFYADDGMVGLRDPNWLQHPMNFLFGLFRRFILAANATKSRTMTCQPGTLRTGISEEAMKLWSVEWNSPQGP